MEVSLSTQLPIDLGWKDALVWRLLKYISTYCARVEYRRAMVLGRRLGSLAYALVRRHRSTALAEMARCFPAEQPAALRERLRRVYQHIGMNYVEVFRWTGGKEDEVSSRIRIEGVEHLEHALRLGKGVLVLTAHTGNWDLCALWMARRYPLAIISKNIRNQGLNRFWMDSRENSGLSIVPARRSYRTCLRVLQQGGLLGFVLDQNTQRKDGEFVEFFGKPACTTLGLAFLAAHTGAPVLPIFIHRMDDGTHRVRMLPCLNPPVDRETPTLIEATQAYTRIIEDVIREYPDQWIWMHRRWRTTPDVMEERAR